MSNVPKLRFKEYNDDWMACRLIDIAELQRGFDLPSTSRINGDIPVISSGGVSGFHNTAKVEPPGVVMGRYGSIGEVFYVECDFWPLNTTLWVKNFKGNIPKFSYYLLSRIDYTKYSDKTGVPGVNRNDLHRIKSGKPNQEEQQKIADFLTAVDTKIEQLTRKEELLKQYKKGVMQKIFSQEIRFKADDGSEFPEWEVNHLSDLVDIRKGSQLNKDTLTEQGAYPALNGGINPSGYTDDWNTESGTVTISEGGNSCGYVNLVKTRFWSGGHNYSLQKVKASTSSQYLYHYLKFSELKIMRLRVGSGLPNIQKGDLSGFEIKLPCMNEQEKISGLLSALDEKIWRAQEQISSAKTFKKGLLQQMFV